MVTSFILIASHRSPPQSVPASLTVAQSLKFVQERHPNCYPNKHFLKNLHLLYKDLVPKPTTTTTTMLADQTIAEDTNDQEQ